MAVVYEATNRFTKRRHALKLVKPRLLRDQKLVDMFIREAQIGSVIGRCPYIVDVTDAGFDEGRGVPYLVMDLLEGETMEQALDRGPLPTDVLSVYLRQLGRALDQAHAAGIVHRDLKPSNLFLTVDYDGAPRLVVLDFGIAKAVGAGACSTGTSVGTPHYAAPEQFTAGLRKLATGMGVSISKDVSPATDVWALALVAYEALTGHQPGQVWGVETHEDIPVRILEAEAPVPSARAEAALGRLPAGFDSWFRRCVQIAAHERIQSAQTAIDELLALLSGFTASPATAPRRGATVETRFPVATLDGDARLETSAPQRVAMPRAAGPVTGFASDVATMSPDSSAPLHQPHFERAAAHQRAPRVAELEPRSPSPPAPDAVVRDARGRRVAPRPPAVVIEPAADLVGDFGWRRIVLIASAAAVLFALALGAIALTK